MSRLWTTDDGRRNVKIELEFWKQNSQYSSFIQFILTVYQRKYSGMQGIFGISRGCSKCGVEQVGKARIWELCIQQLGAWLLFQAFPFSKRFQAFPTFSKLGMQLTITLRCPTWLRNKLSSLPRDEIMPGCKPF